jgi:hypothetical protein
MTRITTFAFQPFESRQGRDTVVGLRFKYDPALIDTLKDAIRTAARHLRQRNLGGWLPEHKCWFVERRAWRMVRQRLVEAGCTITDEPAEESPTPPPPPGATPPAAWEPIVRRWYRDLVMRWHPDRGGSTAAMQMINECHSRLQKLLGRSNCR